MKNYITDYQAFQLILYQSIILALITEGNQNRTVFKTSEWKSKMLILEVRLHKENSRCNLKFHLDFFHYIYTTSQCKNIFSTVFPLNGYINIIKTII